MRAKLDTDNICLFIVYPVAFSTDVGIYVCTLLTVFTKTTFVKDLYK